MKKIKSEVTDKETLKFIFRLLTPANALVMELAYTTGLRLGDCLKIKRADFRQNMTIIEEKTKKKKKIHINKALFVKLSAYADNSSKSAFIFPHRFDEKKHRTRQAVWYDVRRAAKALRCREHISPHSARKMYAVMLLHKGYSISQIKQKLNHDNEAVTIIYIMSELMKKNKF